MRSPATFWSVGSEGGWKNSPSRLFNRRGFTGNSSAALPLKSRECIYSRKAIEMSHVGRPAASSKKALRAARWEAHIKSDLEGDESDGVTHVLNPSEWIWRSLRAARCSLTQLLKEDVSECCFWVFCYYQCQYNLELQCIRHFISQDSFASYSTSYAIFFFLLICFYFIHCGHTCYYQYISCWNQLPLAGLIKLRVSPSVSK